METPLPVFTSKTSLSLSEVIFDESDIVSILNKLQPNKAHGWDGISIRMIKIYGDRIVVPLLIIYKNCISKGVFPLVGNWPMSYLSIKRMKKYSN